MAKASLSMANNEAEFRLLHILVAAAERGDIDPGNIYIFSGRTGEPLEVMDVPEADGVEMKHLRALERKGWITLAHRKGSEYRGTLTDAAFRYVEGSSAANGPGSLEAMVLDKLHEVTGGDPERKVKFDELLLFFEQPSEEVALAIRKLKAKQKVATVESSNRIAKVLWTSTGLREYVDRLGQEEGALSTMFRIAPVPPDDYVSQMRIEELRGVKSDRFDLARLVQLCAELNVVWAAKAYCATAILQRAILDHVPPIFEADSFKQAASQLKGKSLRSSMQRPDKGLRDIADRLVHDQIQRKEPLPSKQQVNFQQELDVLLQEVLRRF